MTTRSVLVVGAGKRVPETALPAFERARGQFEVVAIAARSARELSCAGRSWRVRPLAELASGDLTGVELVYCAVAKPAVPAVLAALLERGAERAALLVDTPVLPLEHVGRRRLLARFRAAWAAEDCAELPWIELARVAATEIGALREVTFERSAYAYHGHATAKALFAPARLLSASRRPRGAKAARRVLGFDGGRRASLIEPRDYTSGALLIAGERGALADRETPGAARIELVLRGGRLAGLAAAGARVALDDDEIALAHGEAGWPAEASLTARHEGLKRVGFLRLLRRIAAGAGAYPVEEALEDSIADRLLHKLGFWRPALGLGSPAGRLALGAAARMLGGS